MTSISGYYIKGAACCGARYKTPRYASINLMSSAFWSDGYRELAARRDYWQHLNHAYRDLYKAHREAEEAASRAAWEAAHPEQRTAWQKLRKFERRPQYQAAPDRPITFPAFEASPEQRKNMQALLQLLEAPGEKTDLEQVELHRELGQFEEAARALQRVKAMDNPALHKLSAQLIAGRRAAPVRYRP